MKGSKLVTTIAWIGVSCFFALLGLILFLHRGRILAPHGRKCKGYWPEELVGLEPSDIELTEGKVKPKPAPSKSNIMDAGSMACLVDGILVAAREMSLDLHNSKVPVLDIERKFLEKVQKVIERWCSTKMVVNPHNERQDPRVTGCQGAPIGG